MKLYRVIFICGWTLLSSIHIAYTQDGFEWSIYKDDTYTIQHPKGWTHREGEDYSEAIRIEFYLVSEPQNMQDDFYENLNIVTENIGKMDLTLEEYGNLSLKNIQKVYKKLKIFSQKTLESGGSPYYQFEYTHVIEESKVFICQGIWMKEGKVHIITLCCAYNEKKKWQNIFQFMLREVRIS